MAELQDVISYACAKYPYASSVPLSTLTKILYLAEWRSAITRKRQLTQARWLLNQSGPFSPDIATALAATPTFAVGRSQSIFKPSPLRVSLRQVDAGWKGLTVEDKEVLDFVLRVISTKSYGEFIRLVESTYPVYKNPENTAALDLVGLAERYLSERSLVPV